MGPPRTCEWRAEDGGTLPRPHEWDDVCNVCFTGVRALFARSYHNVVECASFSFQRVCKIGSFYLQVVYIVSPAGVYRITPVVSTRHSC